MPEPQRDGNLDPGKWGTEDPQWWVRIPPVPSPGTIHTEMYSGEENFPRAPILSSGHGGLDRETPASEVKSEGAWGDSSPPDSPLMDGAGMGLWLSKVERWTFNPVIAGSNPARPVAFAKNPETSQHWWKILNWV